MESCTSALFASSISNLRFVSAASSAVVATVDFAAPSAPAAAEDGSPGAEEIGAAAGGTGGGPHVGGGASFLSRFRFRALPDGGFLAADPRAAQNVGLMLDLHGRVRSRAEARCSMLSAAVFLGASSAAAVPVVGIGGL